MDAFVVDARFDENVLDGGGYASVRLGNVCRRLDGRERLAMREHTHCR